MASCNSDEPGNPDVKKAIQSSDTTKKSIATVAKKRIGNTDVSITYNAPAVRGRKIWGGLVSYDKIWVTGAHNATTLEVGKDFHVGKKMIPSGKYAIFTIPGVGEWTIIINKNWEQHLTDEYSEKDDLARFTVKPRMKEDVTERLQYEIDQTGERTADIIIRWEKLSVNFPIEIIP